MELRFVLTLKEFGEGYRTLLGNTTWRHRLLLWTYTWLGVALGLFIIGCESLVILAGGEDVAFVALLLFFGALGLSAPIRFRFMIRRQFRLQNLEKEIAISAGTDGLVVRRLNRDAETRFGWSSIEKQRETANLFVLFPSKVQFLPIPRRAMTQEQQQEFLALLAAHGLGSGSRRTTAEAVS